MRASKGAQSALDAMSEPNVISAGALEVLVCALAEQGRLDDAEGALGEFCEIWRGDTGFEIGVSFARARLALASRDFETAEREAREVGRLRAAQGRLNPTWTAWRATLALALAHQGRFNEAVPVADEEVRLAVRFGARSAIAIARHARVVSECDIASRAEAAEAALLACDPRFVLARARLQTELGSALVRLGDRVEAREHLRPAFAAADAAGATPLAEQARRALVASGLRPRLAATEGLAALTPRQRQICDLAASGKSNRLIAQELFLSVKTVETHLAASYAKLGVASRVAMAAMVANQVSDEAADHAS